MTATHATSTPPIIPGRWRGQPGLPEGSRAVQMGLKTFT